MEHCDFKGEIKVDCIIEIVKLARSGETGFKVYGQILQHAGCFLGSAGKLLEDSADPPVIGAATAPTPVEDMTDEQLVDALEAAQMQPMAMTGDPVASVNWQLIMQIVSLITEILRRRKA